MPVSMSSSRILEVGFGFWHSKVLLTAVELGVFTCLSDQPMRGSELGAMLKLHPRGVWDFLDALVSMDFLHRDGEGESAYYKNTNDTAYYLDKTKLTYIGGVLEMCSERLFRIWDDLDIALKTGKPQNENKYRQKPIFEELYEDPPRLEQFMNAMRGLSYSNYEAFSEKFDFSQYKSLCDVGGATALLSSLVAKKHAHLKCSTFDLPQVEPIAKKWLAKEGLLGRVAVVSGNFFEDELPVADIITMGLILHDWDLERKKHLIQLAFNSLPEGGVLIAIENIIDDERRENTFGLMMSLNMLMEFGDAFDFTGADFWGWCKEAGFKRYEIMHLSGSCSAAIAYK